MLFSCCFLKFFQKHVNEFGVGLRNLLSLSHATSLAFYVQTPPRKFFDKKKKNLIRMNTNFIVNNINIEKNIEEEALEKLK